MAWRMAPERPQAWYAEDAGFFGPGYLFEYTDLLPPERTLREVEFLQETVRLEHGLNILDLACGHGRHAVELARRGYRVTGQDLNAFFLAEAKRAAESAGVDVRWVRSDVRRIPFRESFGAVISLFTSFGFFGDEDDGRVVRETARALRRGGVFVLDVPNREWLIRNYRESERRELSDGGSVLIERAFDPETGWNRERRVRIQKAGERQELHIDFRLYTLDELVVMCTAAGLREVRVYGDFDGAAFGEDSPRSIVVARKAEA